MNISVRFPSSSIEGDISRYLLSLQNSACPKELIQNPKPACRRLITDAFVSACGELGDLLTARAVCEQIDVEINDDLGRKRPTALGWFNIYRSNAIGRPAFSISGHMVLDLVCRNYGIPSPGALSSHRRLWIHELAHLTDWNELRHMGDRAERDAESYLRQTVAPLRFTPASIDAEMPRSWQFLHAMAHFRDEGLACLQEKLICGSDLAITTRGEALVQFRKLFDALHAFLTRARSWHESADYADIGASLFKQAHSQAYSIGPWLIAEALTRHSREDWSLVSRALSSPAPCMSVADAVRMLRRGFTMDLGGFLRALTGDAITGEMDPFIKTGELMALCHFISLSDSQPNEYPGFAAAITECAATGNATRFITVLKEVLGSPMTDAELEAARDETPTVTDLERTPDAAELLKRRAAQAWAAWRKDRENPLLRWMLTFLCDSDDVIQDDMAYLGFLDDELVVEAGLRIYALTPSHNTGGRQSIGTAPNAIVNARRTISTTDCHSDS